MVKLGFIGAQLSSSRWDGWVTRELFVCFVMRMYHPMLGEGARIYRLEVSVINIRWGSSHTSGIMKHFIAATNATDWRLLRC